MLIETNEGHKCFLEEVIACGQFGVVYKGNYENSVIAVKRLTIKDQPEYYKPYIYQEIQILSSCQDDNIVKYSFHLETKDHIYIGMEYCDFTTKDLVDTFSQGCLPEHLVIIWMEQMSNAFYALHQNSIIHRDLKIENVLAKVTPEQLEELKGGNLEVIRQIQFKLADLGFAKSLKNEDLTLTECGTAGYMAPEIFQGLEYGIQADLFSLGVCVYELLFGCLPFTEYDPEILIEQMKKEEIQLEYPGVEVSDMMKQLIKSMLRFNVEERLTWSDFYKHPILKSMKDPIGIKMLNLQDIKNHLRVNIYSVAEQKLKSGIGNQFNYVGMDGDQQNPQITQRSIIIQPEENRENTPLYRRIANLRNSYAILLAICYQIEKLIQQLVDEEIKQRLNEEKNFFYEIAYNLFAELDVEKIRKNFLDIQFKGQGYQGNDPMYLHLRQVVLEDQIHFKQTVQKKTVFTTEYGNSMPLVDKNMQGRYEMRIQTTLSFLAINKEYNQQVNQEDAIHLQYYILQAKDILKNVASESTQKLISAESLTLERVKTLIELMKKNRQNIKKAKIYIIE